MSNANTFLVIMAGGSGSRFWPASRPECPKQMLPLGPSDRSLLAETVRRGQAVTSLDRILVVTSSSLQDAVRDEIPDLPAENILAEPVARNTAPCIGWASVVIRRRSPDATIVVLPADHHIGDENALQEAIVRGISAAQSGALVTIGVCPTRPETGYGYIKRGEKGEGPAWRVDRFVEKPDRARAEAYLESGDYLWNSGMFVFRADKVLEAVKAHLPKLYTGLQSFDVAAARSKEQAVIDAEFGLLPSVSFDNGIMEKADHIAVIPVECGWSDLGSWTTAWELADRDDEDNSLPTDAVSVGSSRCLVQAPAGKTVAIVGLEDLVVVDTGDALLVTHLERAQEVRAVVDELRRRSEADEQTIRKAA